MNSDNDLSDQIANQLRRLLDDRENEELRQEIDIYRNSHPSEFGEAIKNVYQLPPDNRSMLPDSHTVKRAPAGEWQNCIDNQHCKPNKIEVANSLEDLVRVVNDARARNSTVRVVGAGHSFANVAITYDKGAKQESILIQPNGLNGVELIDASLLRTGIDASHLVVVESGTTIQKLNQELDKMHLALINMGAYDHQTIAGAISTGTHGTGVGLGPIGSSVRSIVLVSESGKKIQIEPSSGITDPEKFKLAQPDTILKQDDDWFQANILAMGCMGLIYSYTLQVDTEYLLREDRRISDWNTVRSKLLTTSPSQIPPILTATRHYEVDVNPYPIAGKRLCIETTRYIPSDKQPRGSRGFVNWLSGVLAQWRLAQEAILLLLNHFPAYFVPSSIDSGLKTLVDQNYVDKSYKVLNLGAVNSIPAYAIELSFDVANVVTNLDKLFDLFVRFSKAESGRPAWWIGGPVGVRFVQASDAYLAPQYGRVTCMAELDMLVGINHGDELLRAIEKEMTVDTTVRVHWGLELDILDGPQVQKMYPKYDRWLDIYRQMNTTGMFNSPLTDRLGITVNH